MSTSDENITTSAGGQYVGHGAWGQISLPTKTVSSKSIAKPGEWFGQPEVGWSPKTRRMSAVAAAATALALILTVVSHGHPYAISGTFICSLLLLNLLGSPPIALGMEDPPNDEEAHVRISITQGLKSIGVDSGILWFEGSRVWFTGHACSIVLASEDIRWEGHYDNEPFSDIGGRLNLVTGCTIWLTSTHPFPFLDKFTELKRSPDLGHEDRILPPTTPQQKQFKKISWCNPRAWLPVLPSSSDELPRVALLLSLLITFGSYVAITFLTTWHFPRAIAYILLYGYITRFQDHFGWSQMLSLRVGRRRK